jgi:hypothetical protein
LPVTPAPITKVVDIAYARLAAPDLDLAEEFLTHFGLVRAARTMTALYSDRLNASAATARSGAMPCRRISSITRRPNSARLVGPARAL